jgi:hypothetical protein
MTYNPPPHYSFGDPGEPQQPQSAPPSYGPQPPQSGPPAYSPASPAAPGAGYVPAQPAGPQVAPPMMTQPLMVPPAQRRSALVPVLAVVAVIGFAGAALSLALWLRASGDLDDANAQVEDRDSDIAELQESLDSAETQVSELEVEAADAASMRSCLEDLAWFYATEAGSEEETQAQLAIQESCSTWLF